MDIGTRLQNRKDEPTNGVTLSIIMPVFNHHDDVAVMIDSILANDFSSWELLAVDDGSDADTLAMLERYAQNDGRIRVIRRGRQPKGAQTCRNIGLEKAVGEYLVFFDSDDFVTPYCLRQRVEAISAHAEYDFMVFPSGIYEKGQFMPIAHPYVFGYHIYKDDVAQFASRQLPFIVWNNIYRTAPLRASGVRWDERLLSLQDADFNVSAIASGLRYGYACGARPDYGYRIGSEQSVSKNIIGNSHIQSHVYANAKMYDVVCGFCGRRYRRSLFRGTLNLYNACLSGNGIDNAFADRLAGTLRHRDAFHWMVLRIQTAATRMLGKVLPGKRARQLPMLCFLIGRNRQERIKMARLSDIISNSSKNIQQTT